MTRALAGALPGAAIGLIAACLFYRPEPPASWTYLASAFLIGAALGSALGLAAGTSSVPVFWLYFVLLFGAITCLPLWYFEKTDEYLPLGTVYANALAPGVFGVLIPDALISIVMAAFAAYLHDKWKNRKGTLPTQSCGRRAAAESPATGQRAP
jgi:hypothetical protein